LFSRIGLQALFIDRGRPWEDGYNESFTVKTHDELLNRETFYTLMEAHEIVVVGKANLG
jgi:hypothetical protein